MSPDEKVRRGEAAQRILSEPVVKEALKAIKDEIIKVWSDTTAKDAEGREWAWRHHKVAERFEVILKGYIETGRFEAGLIEQKKKGFEFFKR